ncbi:MAG TPA: Hsp33 family molecular chaperone HslO [Alphaproteobacteria bacterium]|jgi:molecular chaperone Hsp33
MAASASVADDLVQPFRVERAGLRGRFVRLGPLLTEVLNRHDYPEPVAELLGEVMALTALLGSALKFDGVFTLQTSGKGPVAILVADMTSDGALRGYAQFDPGRVAEVGEGDSGPVPSLLGPGHLAFTVDQGSVNDRYQGIVELTGATLADCIHHYFRQSEQIDAALKVAVARDEAAEGGTRWHAGAIMVQRLPAEAASAGPAAEDEDDWREAVALMGSATPEELTDPCLPPDRLLYRLFHEPGVRAYAPQGLSPGCRCSRRRVARTLAAFPRAEVMALMEEGVVSVRCEFCGESYVFDEAALRALFEDSGAPGRPRP